MNARALIAEDEALLAQALRAELAAAWPQLEVVAEVGDGQAAVAQALALQPEVLFFDIRMPGLGGLEAAADIAEAWPADRPFPALVFVTAYDQYALQAFEAQAVDYLLKPVQSHRLARTVARVQQRLAQRSPAQGMDAVLGQLRALLDPKPQPALPGAPAQAPLRVLQVGVGTQIRMVPLDQVVCLEAADKYVRVLTPGHEYLLRTPLRELLPQLDAAQFWQVHRGTVVRADAIESAQRDAAGRLQLRLRGRSEPFGVSRLYAHLFRAM
ncbi:MULTISPECIES: LytTR family DNA-binding domain-containing protein [Ramlibacter]|uniref:Response regulator transcription factor n=1 Tax=Ramlibacter aquaticus TaxID=2780094 RepID=A0ABR9S9H0_9BURK|nr:MULTISPECIES: LytTR family DNA-binding domain-containing protein [Ramlibacter]MBE7938981.1 response regulator transcription factor [Ramlibacter aquaticus]